jgi:NADH-quinone oxidoreductase subunit H
LGAVRSSAQLIAYDISLSTIILNIVLITKHFNLTSIIIYQVLYGNFIYYYFFLFLLFFICCVAETNRHPFDLPEAESELVSGYNVEYSSINFALFFLGEYTSILFMSFFIVILFWGG